MIARTRVEAQTVPREGRMALKGLPSQLLARLYGKMDCTDVTEVPLTGLSWMIWVGPIYHWSPSSNPRRQDVAEGEVREV